MAGLLPAAASMTDRLTLGYRAAVTTTDSPLGPAGTVLRGHEFHYSTVEPSGDALELTSRWGTGRAGFAVPVAAGDVPPSPPRWRPVGGRRLPRRLPGGTVSIQKSMPFLARMPDL